MSATACKFNHVAVSVDDCGAAVKWYTETLGFHEIIPSVTMRRKEDPDGIVFRVYGGKLHDVKVAYLGTGNQIGFEVFEFITPKYEGPTTAAPMPFNTSAWTRGGFFHIAVTAPEPEMLAQQVERNGGKRFGQAVSLPNGEEALYVQDPWGNVIEICSTDFESLITPRS